MGSLHGQVTSVWVVILVILPGLIRETDLEKMYKYPENRIQIIEKHSLPCVVLYGLVLPLSSSAVIALYASLACPPLCGRSIVVVCIGRLSSTSRVTSKLSPFTQSPPATHNRLLSQTTRHYYIHVSRPPSDHCLPVLSFSTNVQ